MTRIATINIVNLVQEKEIDRDILESIFLLLRYSLKTTKNRQSSNQDIRLGHICYDVSLLSMLYSLISMVI